MKRYKYMQRREQKQQIRLCDFAGQHLKFIKENKTKIEELNLKIKSLEEEVLRSKADLINYRKRKDEETSNLLKYGNSDILLQIVNVLDDFDRALNVKEENLTPEVNNFLIGFKLIDKSLKDILTSNNVKEIECLGEKFDPNMEQSLCSKCDNTKEDEEVLEVLTKGYTYYDRVLRYASVMINKKDVNNLNIENGLEKPNERND